MYYMRLSIMNQLLWVTDLVSNSYIVGEFNILADGLNVAHIVATQTTPITFLLKMFETLTQFAVSNQFGVSIDKNGWSFKIKDWKAILPQLVKLKIFILTIYSQVKKDH